MDPVLSPVTELFGRDFLDLIGSVETWVSKDQQTTTSMLSFKVTTLSSTKLELTV
jgi:hypothetical protein